MTIIDFFKGISSSRCIHLINEVEFIVYDPKESHCYINTKSTPGDSSFCRILNNNKKDITFFSVDKCLINQDSTKKCDFALYDGLTYYFVEIKTCATGNRGKRRIEAIEQLKITFEYLKEQSVELHKIVAQVCFGSSRTIPAFSSSRVEDKAIFNSSYNCDLREGNEIQIL